MVSYLKKKKKKNDRLKNTGERSFKKVVIQRLSSMVFNALLLFGDFLGIESFLGQK